MSEQLEETTGIERFDATGTCPKCGEFWVVTFGQLWKVELQDLRCTCGTPILEFIEPANEREDGYPEYE